MFDVAVEEDVSTRQEVAAAPAGASPQPTNWTLNLIGVLSISLGVMNLFPIPALDGGRILFTIPEILFRKRIPTAMGKHGQWHCHADVDRADALCQHHGFR